MQNTKKTYLIIQLEIEKESNIDNIIIDLRDTQGHSYVIEHPRIVDHKIIGSSDGLIFD